MKTVFVIALFFAGIVCAAPPVKYTPVPSEWQALEMRCAQARDLMPTKTRALMMEKLNGAKDNAEILTAKQEAGVPAACIEKDDY